MFKRYLFNKLSLLLNDVGKGKKKKKKKQEITSWQGCIEKENPKHCWWESKLEQPLWKQ